MADNEELKARLSGYLKSLDQWKNDCEVLKVMESFADLSHKVPPLQFGHIVPGDKRSSYGRINTETLITMLKYLKKVLTGEKLSNPCGSLSCKICSSSANCQSSLHLRGLLKWFESSLMCDCFEVTEMTSVCCISIENYMDNIEVLHSLLKIISLYTSSQYLYHRHSVIKRVICDDLKATAIAQCRRHEDERIRRLAHHIIDDMTPAVHQMAVNGNGDPLNALDQQLTQEQNSSMTQRSRRMDF